MTQDTAFMRLALEQAQEARKDGEIPVGAIVVKEGRVLGVGRNMSVATHDPSAHAEIVALRAAAQTLGNYRLEGCELYVTLEPCAMCAGAILHARISRLVYGAADPKTGAAGSVMDLFANSRLNHHTQVCANVLADECSGTLRSFFQARRQTRAAQAQALSDDALRTPLSVFADLQDYPFTPHFFIDGEKLHGWRMHYLDEGCVEAACVVLCLHDLPGWSYRFRALIPALKAKGLRALVPDLIGFGASDKPKKETAHTIDLHLRSLQMLLASLGAQKLLIVAEGKALHLARMLVQSKVVRVINVVQVASDPDVASDSRPFPDKGYQAGWKAAAKLVRQMEQASGKPKHPVDGVILNGTPDKMAEQIFSITCNG